MASREVDEAVGEAPERPNVFDQLEAKRKELVEAQTDLERAHKAFDTDGVLNAENRVRVLEKFVIDLEIAAEVLTEQEAAEDARKRVLGIRKAIGSLEHEMSKEEPGIRAAHAQLVEALTRTNRLFRDIGRMQNEVAALVDRFGLTEKALQAITPPGVRFSDLEPLPVLPDVVQPIRPTFEEHPDTEWKRRTYEEVAGTPAKEIIDHVGPKVWPPLSPEQQAEVDKAKERRQREAAALSIGGVPSVPAQSDFTLANIV